MRCSIWYTLIASATVCCWGFAVPQDGKDEIITQLGTSEKVVALTFDACETTTPSYFDEKILKVLNREKVPYTIFIGGKFIKRNQKELSELAKSELVEIENHSYNHVQHMERLTEKDIAKEVRDNEELILHVTGRKPIFFRFPGGNCDARSLKEIAKLGYRVVHWTFPSGDPDKKVTPPRLRSWVVNNTKPGSILIFHANGRGYSTGEALPNIIADLRKKHYRFVRLDEYLKSSMDPSRPSAGDKSESK